MLLVAAVFVRNIRTNHIHYTGDAWGVSGV